MPRWWIVVFLLRLGWTLVGQDGYIHPDEFFQSTEVIAGKYNKALYVYHHSKSDAIILF